MGDLCSERVPLATAGRMNCRGQRRGERAMRSDGAQSRVGRGDG